MSSIPPSDRRRGSGSVSSRKRMKKRPKRYTAGSSRKPNVYEAVAGRAQVTGRKPDPEDLPQGDPTEPRRPEWPALTPDEVLFKNRAAPVRYAEADLYEQDRDLPADVELPDSDLLEAIHVYASDFYDRQFPDDCKASQLSMDETALLAIGMLLEETAAEILGPTGDLALAEGRVEEDVAEALGDVNGFTHEDLPSLKHLSNHYPKLRHKGNQEGGMLGFMRFTHPSFATRSHSGNERSDQPE